MLRNLQAFHILASRRLLNEVLSLNAQELAGDVITVAGTATPQ